MRAVVLISVSSLTALSTLEVAVTVWRSCVKSAVSAGITARATKSPDEPGVSSPVSGVPSPSVSLIGTSSPSTTLLPFPSRQISQE